MVEFWHKNNLRRIGGRGYFCAHEINFNLPLSNSAKSHYIVSMMIKLILILVCLLTGNVAKTPRGSQVETTISREIESV